MTEKKVKFLYLSEEDTIRAGALNMRRCLEMIDETFKLTGGGDYLMGGPGGNEHGAMLWFPEEQRSPNMPVAGPDRRFMTMLAYLGGHFDVCGAKWYGSNVENPKSGLPRSILLVALNDPVTSKPLALMSGNLISAMRTGAVPGVAAKYLSRRGAETVGLVGCGVINRACLVALAATVEDAREIKVFDVDKEKAGAFAADMSEELEISVCPVGSLEEADVAADVVSVATAGARRPAIETRWLKEGCLLASSGTAELAEGCYTENTVVVDNWRMHLAWHRESEEHPKGLQGLLDWAPSWPLLKMSSEGKIGDEDVLNLGDIALAKVVGRSGDEDRIGVGQELTLWEEPHWSYRWVVELPTGKNGLSPDRRRLGMADAIVVGAGVIGSSTAFHLAEQGVETLVLDRDVLAAGSTARSGALIRAHYTTALEADLAWQSLTEYFEMWGERVGGGCGFTRTGFARLVEEGDREALAGNVAMLKERVGVETELVDPAELKDIDDSLALEAVAAAAYEPRGGYADPTATALGFLRMAENLGARFERERVEGLLEREGAIRGVRTRNGDVEAPVVVLASGAWSVPLAESVGLRLPVRPARVQVALFERPQELPTHLTLIDTANEVYARPTADRCTLVGRRLTEAEWLHNPDEYAPVPDDEFADQAARRIGKRIPALKGASYRSGWAGVVDMTPDGRPLLGPEGPEGLYLALGWSGAGFKKAPAVGVELARWIRQGAPKRSELRGYNLRRFKDGNLIRGQYEYGSSASPH